MIPFASWRIHTLCDLVGDSFVEQEIEKQKVQYGVSCEAKVHRREADRVVEQASAKWTECETKTSTKLQYADQDVHCRGVGDAEQR